MTKQTVVLFVWKKAQHLKAKQVPLWQWQPSNTTKQLH